MRNFPPRGPTGAALRLMDQGEVVEAFVRAVQAAAIRSREASGDWLDRAGLTTS